MAPTKQQSGLSPSTIRSRKLRDERAAKGWKEMRGVFLPAELEVEGKKVIRAWVDRKVKEAEPPAVDGSASLPAA